MPDIQEAPPVVVNPSPATDQAAAAVRTLVLLISVGTTIAGLVSKHDLTGFVAYVQSSQFLTALSFAIGAGTFAWGQWKTRKRAKQLITVASSDDVPDSVAKLKQ